eukprot:SAG25_NODE_33_length_20262_cov_33.203293_20_plen_83_part_00
MGTLARADCAWVFGAMLAQSWLGAIGTDLCTGAGEDNGIDHSKEPTEISLHFGAPIVSTRTCITRRRTLTPILVRGGAWNVW